ncbi:MAG: quinol monooxygenase YgiN [Planctomycetota bacterium]|jgi:quinol monooxygenase YgiN
MGVMLIVSITAKPGRGVVLAELLQPVPKDNEIGGCFGIDIFTNNAVNDEILIIEHWDSIDTHKEFLSALHDSGGLDKMLELSASVSRNYYAKVDD